MILISQKKWEEFFEMFSFFVRKILDEAMIRTNQCYCLIFLSRHYWGFVCVSLSVDISDIFYPDWKSKQIVHWHFSPLKIHKAPEDETECLSASCAGRRSRGATPITHRNSQSSLVLSSSGRCSPLRSATSVGGLAELVHRSTWERGLVPPGALRRVQNRTSRTSNPDVGVKTHSFISCLSLSSGSPGHVELIPAVIRRRQVAPSSSQGQTAHRFPGIKPTFKSTEQKYHLQPSNFTFNNRFHANTFISHVFI